MSRNEKNVNDRWALDEPDVSPTRISERAYDSKIELLDLVLGSIDEALEESPGKELLTGLARGALAHQVHQALRDIIGDIDRIERVELDPPKNLAAISRQGREWITPVGLDKNAGKGNHNRKPIQKGEEARYALEPDWDGANFVIVNSRSRSFRAWSANFYAPPQPQEMIPGKYRSIIDDVDLPPKAWSTALLRLLLGHTTRLRKNRLLILNHDGTCDWAKTMPSAPDKHLAVLPQAYVLNAVGRIGMTCGVSTKFLSPSRCEVLWNGSVFKIGETINLDDWWHPEAK